MAQLFGLATIGRDAEVRYTQSGDPVASLSLAFSYGKKGDDGKRPTQWVDGSLWGKLAESIAPYCLKGTKVAVTLDDVRIEVFQGKNGEGHKLVGQVSKIELAGSASGATSAPAKSAQAQQPKQQAQSKQATNFSDMDDTIPF